MFTKPKSLVKNIFLEINFILFPIWILPTYFLIKSFFNSPEIPFLLFLILLGESHFGSTFLFFFDKSNQSYIKKKSLLLLYLPIIFLVAFFLFGLNNFEYAIIILSAASGFHVTRQSIGIARLYEYKRNRSMEILIYSSSAIFLFIGFLRLYLVDLDYNFFQLSTVFINLKNFLIQLANNNSLKSMLVVIFSFLALNENTNYKKRLVNLTGILIYSPYLFLNQIYDAIVIGVGAHWAQYLLLNYKVYFYGLKCKKKRNSQILIIFSYAIVMSLLGYRYHFTREILKGFVLIPICAEMFHFYIDAFIWKFSDPDIRKNIGSKLFAD